MKPKKEMIKQKSLNEVIRDINAQNDKIKKQVIESKKTKKNE